VTALVLDASAAVELISRTAAGAQRQSRHTNDKVLWIPDGIFDVEVNAALRRPELRQKMSTAQCETARLRIRHLRLR